ncbi:MAG: GH92 family glycosyl hydrolase [Flavobacteriales bacterium]
MPYLKRFCLLILIFHFGSIHAQEKLTNWVDPFVGTGGHGHTFPGAVVPFGMMQLSPDTRIDGSWDGCSGYHYSDSKIYGFSHTHLSGTGVSDYGDIAFLPVTTISAGQMKKGVIDYKRYAQSFSHASEKASPGYYFVELANGVKSEFTVSPRCGMHNYIFPKKGNPALIIQLDHRDKTIMSSMSFTDNKTVLGFRRSESWAKDQHIYFAIEFSEEFATPKIQYKKVGDRNNVECMVLPFPKAKGKELKVRIGISNVSIEGAKNNLKNEISDWDFNKLRNKAETLWENELNKITVSGGTNDQRKIFYSSLYHTMIHPSLATDVDASYRGMDGVVHKAEGFTYYSVFSLWDTFRATHPLYTILDKKRTIDFIKTFLVQFEQSGRLPVWELSSNETDCMIGYHSVSVITDAVMKNISDFDLRKALNAMVVSARANKFGLKDYIEFGHLSVDMEHESVSKTLEYAYDDWCIAILAEQLNETEIAKDFFNRSNSWKNSFDPQTGFMRPRKNGAWLSPFDPREVNNHFTEANSWQYSFFVPHDVDGMIQFFGGAKHFEEKLNSLFTASSAMLGRDQADITGLIGQYAHGNEPSHHMAYLYNYVGRPDKTQKIINQIMSSFYTVAPDGLIGNEDCGQMSAWYVLSAMGFYQVTPGDPYYSVGVPLFDQVKIKVDDEKICTIRSQSRSDKNAFVTRVNSDFRMSVSHQEIMQGGTIVLEFGEEKTILENLPKYLASNSIPAARRNKYVPIPYFSTGVETFRDSLVIELISPDPSCSIYYTTDGIAPNVKAKKYNSPLVVKESIVLKAIAVDPSGIVSKLNFGSFNKIDHNWSVVIQSSVNPQYTAGGPFALVDGLLGDQNWRKGRWIGVQGQDFESVIDLKQSTRIMNVRANFLEDTRAWIWLPDEVSFFFSEDGKEWKEWRTIQNDSITNEYSERIKGFEIKKSGMIQARYIKVKAKNHGKIPAWHPGSGNDSFIFIDEVQIN